MVIRAAAVILFSLFLVACDGVVGCRGVVLDQDEKPISGAHVSILGSGNAGYLTSAVTSADGAFDLFIVVAPGDYKLRLLVQAKGYKSASIQFPTRVKSKVVARLVPSSALGESTVKTWDQVHFRQIPEQAMIPEASQPVAR